MSEFANLRSELRFLEELQALQKRALVPFPQGMPGPLLPIPGVPHIVEDGLSGQEAPHSRGAQVPYKAGAVV